jgi:formylmethanofuran dehydrogenase subunit E
MLYEVWAARPRRSGVFCCDRCRSKWHNRRHSQVRKQQRQRYLAKACEVCGEEFTAKRVDAKTCSPACKQKAYRRRRATN